MPPESSATTKEADFEQEKFRFRISQRKTLKPAVRFAVTNREHPGIEFPSLRHRVRPFRREHCISNSASRIFFHFTCLSAIPFLPFSRSTGRLGSARARGKSWEFFWVYQVTVDYAARGCSLFSACCIFLLLVARAHVSFTFLFRHR